MSLVPSWRFPRWRRTSVPQNEAVSKGEASSLCSPANVSGEIEPGVPTYCSVIFVGFQTELMPLVHGAQKATDVAQVLAGAAQAAGVRAVALEIDQTTRGPTIACVRHRCDSIIEQPDLCTFDGRLLDRLCAGRTAPERFVLAGCEDDIWLLQAALLAMDRGHEACVVQEACISRGMQDAANAAQVLRETGGTLVSATDVVHGWCRYKENQELSALLQLVKRTAAGGSNGWR